MRQSGTLVFNRITDKIEHVLPLDPQADWGTYTSEEGWEGRGGKVMQS